TGIEVPKRALVHTRRIDETVADDPGATRQCRLDGAAYVIGAGGGEQQRLGFDPERLGYSGQQDVANDLGPARAAGLARADDRDAERLQPIGKQARIGRLAGAFAAFESDESSAHML